MLFGSDYAIWEPKWQIEGFLDWEMPGDEAFTDFPRLDTDGKRKILGLNAAKLYGVEVPAELRGNVPADEPASEESAVGVG
jgi:predicted TIM-barrel fold metal-dependent hydrolase